jgi:hypothetical protein
MRGQLRGIDFGPIEDNVDQWYDFRVEEAWMLAEPTLPGMPLVNTQSSDKVECLSSLLLEIGNKAERTSSSREGRRSLQVVFVGTQYKLHSVLGTYSLTYLFTYWLK